jgi:hypothetical protein
MLLKKKIPKTFWPESVNWAILVLNKNLNFAVKNQTPKEAWSGVKPSVEYLRFLGVSLMCVYLIAKVKD